jgi:hypothetical protein
MPRYRLGLTQPLFVVPRPSKMRGLTEAELDELAEYLRMAEEALRRIDEALGGRLAAIEGLESPWWGELRPELLRRGYSPQSLDECMGSVSGIEIYFRERGAPRWLAPLILDIVQRVDPEPFAAAIAEHIPALGKLRVEPLAMQLEGVRGFHAWGAPHQVHITNFFEAFGMKPVARTEGGGTVFGYGEEGRPAKLPFETGSVRLRAGELPADGPEEQFWLPVYEGLLSWIGELAVVLPDRIDAIIGARETIQSLLYEVEFLGRFEGAASLPCHPRLVALADALSLCGHLLSGLFEELNHPREWLVRNLGGVLRCLDASWREPRPQEAEHLAHELRKATRRSGSGSFESGQDPHR